MASRIRMMTMRIPTMLKTSSLVGFGFLGGEDGWGRPVLTASHREPHPINFPTVLRTPNPPAPPGRGCLRAAKDQRRFTCLALVSPPVPCAFYVLARSLAEIGRADDEDLEALRPGLVTSPGAGRDTHRVPPLELDDLVVELHPPAPAQHHVHLLLLLVRVAVRKAIAGRDALVAEAGLLELERLGSQAELQIRRAVEVGPDVLHVPLEVPESERHRAILCAPAARLAACYRPSWWRPRRASMIRRSSCTRREWPLTLRRTCRMLSSEGTLRELNCGASDSVSHGIGVFDPRSVRQNKK